MKNFLRKFVLFLLIFLIPNLYFFGIAEAAPEFQHLITASYVIKEDNSAHVEYHFKTTNKLSNNYLKSYSFIVPFEPLNISATNSQNPLKLRKLNKLSVLNTFEIEFEFINPVYGLDKTFEWSFSFDVKDIVIDHGMQKALIVPTFVQDETFVNYNVSIVLPKKMGEIGYIYGNSGIQENDNNFFLNFVSNRNPATSIIVLLNSSQEYLFEVPKVSAETKVPLPKITEKQRVVYTHFPNKDVFPNQKENGKFLNLQPSESIRGIIRSTKALDKTKDVVESDFPKIQYLDDLVAAINANNLTKTQIAQIIYQDYLMRFSIDDYRITSDLNINVSEEKFKVNSLELNYIYRYLLNKFGIQSRNVYGYVFPIQPFKTTEYKTEAHVWTEFWDGEVWISADPVWYLSSRGTLYFDNNDFTHIAFGNYSKVDDLRTFITADQQVTLTPLTSSEYKEDFDSLGIDITDQVYMNRELQAKIINNSNTPINLKNISLTTASHDIKVLKEFANLDLILYPNSTFNLAFPLDYDLVLLNKRENAEIDVKFGTIETEEKEQSLSSNVVIQSNISSYISIFIFGGFLLFSLVSVFAVNIYKKNLNLKKV